MVNQIGILETMTPMDFLEFRDLLTPSSGFQSAQFRLIENKLCMQADDRIQYGKQRFDKFLDEMLYLISDKCSLNTSVLYTVLLFVSTAKVLSRPMPVSMLLNGRGVSLESMSL